MAADTVCAAATGLKLSFKAIDDGGGDEHVFGVGFGGEEEVEDVAVQEGHAAAAVAIGEVVHEDAFVAGAENDFGALLHGGLESGKIGYLCTDVATVEPIPADSPLLGAPNTLITPHIAWAPKEARMRLMAIAENNLRGYLAGEPINRVG